MPELNSSCFAIREEMRSIEVQKSHVFQIEYERLFDRIYWGLQRGQDVFQLIETLLSIATSVLLLL